MYVVCVYVCVVCVLCVVYMRMCVYVCSVCVCVCSMCVYVCVGVGVGEYVCVVLSFQPYGFIRNLYGN